MNVNWASTVFCFLFSRNILSYFNVLWAIFIYLLNSKDRPEDKRKNLNWLRTQNEEKKHTNTFGAKVVSEFIPRIICDFRSRRSFNYYSNTNELNARNSSALAQVNTWRLRAPRLFSLLRLLLTAKLFAHVIDMLNKHSFFSSFLLRTFRF